MGAIDTEMVHDREHVLDLRARVDGEAVEQPAGPNKARVSQVLERAPASVAGIGGIAEVLISDSQLRTPSEIPKRNCQSFPGTYLTPGSF
jgi:hypothetical protein